MTENEFAKVGFTFPFLQLPIEASDIPVISASLYPESPQSFSITNDFSIIS